MKILTIRKNFRNGSCLIIITQTKYHIMNNSEYNKAENAVDNTKNSLKDAADNAKWKVEVGRQSQRLY